MLPDALRVREEELIAGVVNVVVMSPDSAVREREVKERFMGEEIVISPVVWAREREVVVMVEKGR